MPELCIWAPNARTVEVVDSNKVSFNPPLLLSPTAVPYNGNALSGYWALPHGRSNPLRDRDGYWIKIDPHSGHGGVRYKPDPYSRAMINDVSCSLFKEEKGFPWTDAGFRPPTPESLVIYQIFQGAYVGRGDDAWVDATGANCNFVWDIDRKGDFLQLIKKLDYIQDLGVNAIELLPVNEYCGDDYLGYSSVSFFAIEASYGYPRQNGNSYEDLKRFINAAHEKNIAVIADAVFNHIGKVGDSGFLWNYDSDIENIYFSGEHAWNQSGGDFGMAPDWSRPQVQKYIEDSCVYYLNELHFDGLRFDFTSQIVNKNHDKGSDSGKEALRRILWTIRQQFPEKVITCEHWDEYTGSYDPSMISDMNFDSGWFDFHARMKEALWPYAQDVEGRIADAINGGNYPNSHARVVYANCHDACWWDGGAKTKFYLVSEFNGWRGDSWSQKKARMMHALSFFVPGIPLFFMGDEFAMEGCYNDSIFKYILDWGLEPVEPGPSFKRMFKRLIEIKKTYNPLCQPGSSFEWLHYPADGWFAFKRKRNADVMIVAGNYWGEDMYDYWIDTHAESGNWTQIFNSEGQEFGGSGVGNFENNPNSDCGTFAINIPRNGIVVMNRTSL
jgi:1,4-alpha-glucan branching enzyme